MTKLEQLNNTELNPIEFDAPTGAKQAESFSFTRTHWLLLLLGVLCLLFMAFITIARSIQIVAVTPDLLKPEKMLRQSAEVQLNSKIKLPIGNRLLVLPGTHEVQAQAEGFSSTTQKIEVEGGRHQQFDVVLQPLPGVLDVTLIPAVAAKVFLDGQAVGELPGLLENVPAGQHELTIDAPLYRPAKRSVVVTGRSQTQSLEVTLDPAWGNLSLISEPAGAQIAIDGEAMGVSPLTVKIEEGTHTLSLSADKFKPYSLDFTIAAQQDLELADIALIPADGILEIDTSPSQAAVLLNGEYQGTSPLTLKLKPNQSQKLQLYRAGYRLQTTQINLAPDQREAQQVTLNQDVTKVSFSVVPNDAELIVDGVSRGHGSQTLNLNTLPHRIRVKKAGYVDYQNTVIPTKASSQVVSVKLLTKEQHFWANVPDDYQTKGGQDMKLFKSPGLVKLGSSRRENGRRSNEVVYEARLSKHFYVSKREVTNKQFRSFKPTHNSGNYKRKSLDAAKHPVANVSWQQAALYCNWLSEKEGLNTFYQTKSGFVSGNNVNANGYRLLTEVEWAWLARNKNGDVLTYPWPGSKPASSAKPVGNFADTNATEFIAFTLADYDDGFKASSPVGRFPLNHNGLYDMAGNVSEWVNDWYSSNSELANSSAGPIVDPIGPDEGEFHVIRGGSWARGHLPQLRLAYRDFGAKAKHDVGFRIARYVGEPE